MKNKRLYNKMQLDSGIKIYIYIVSTSKLNLILSLFV